MHSLTASTFPDDSEGMASFIFQLVYSWKFWKGKHVGAGCMEHPACTAGPCQGPGLLSLAGWLAGMALAALVGSLSPLSPPFLTIFSPRPPSSSLFILPLSSPPSRGVFPKREASASAGHSQEVSEFCIWGEHISPQSPLTEPPLGQSRSLGSGLGSTPVGRSATTGQEDPSPQTTLTGLCACGHCRYHLSPSGLRNQEPPFLYQGHLHWLRGLV